MVPSDFPNPNDPINLEIIPTAVTTFSDIQPSSTHTVHSQPISCTLKVRHSPTPSPTNLQVTIDIVTHTVPSERKYNILGNPVFIDSGILPPALHPVQNPSKTNTMTDEFLRTYPKYKSNLPSLYITQTTYKFPFPQDRNFDHYAAYACKTKVLVIIRSVDNALSSCKVFTSRTPPPRNLSFYEIASLVFMKTALKVFQQIQLTFPKKKWAFSVWPAISFAFYSMYCFAGHSNTGCKKVLSFRAREFSKICHKSFKTNFEH